MAKLKRIGVISVALFQGAFTGVFSLFMLVIMKLVGALDAYGLPSWISLLIVGILPVIYAVLGFIIGALMALLYNLLAKFTGGIDIEIA